MQKGTLPSTRALFRKAAKILALSILTITFTQSEAKAQAPPGQSALLNGMHDIEAAKWMLSATPGCDKGWITTLRYIGYTGTPAVDCYSNYTKAGLSIIMRLDYSGSQSFPLNPAHTSGYAKNFATYVSRCPNIHVWIVGNEPNFTVQKSDPDCSASKYAAAYVAVHRRVHALPGHKNDLVLVAPNSPYSPGCIESLRQIVYEIRKRGVQPDGFAIHAYTRVAKGSQLSPAYVTANNTLRDVTKDECPGPARWDDTWYFHFRIYINYIKAIEKLGLTGKPVFITESGNACKELHGNACYPDKDIGYFQALYAEVNRWNNLPTTKTKIRAITPYRWTKNDDGTGRDFEIGRRKNLLQDLKKAFAKRYRWTKLNCGSSGCKSNRDCPKGKICDTSTGQCITPPTKCQTNAQCKADQICIPAGCSNPGSCTSKGRGKFGFPQPIPANKSFIATFQHPTGYAYVRFEYCGPRSGKGKYLSSKKISTGVFRWRFSFPPLPAGVYMFQFTANNGAILVARTRVLIGNCPDNAKRCTQNKEWICRGGNWQVLRNCPGGCQKNICLQCKPDTLRCSGKILQKCRGTNWIPFKTCPYGCQNNRCLSCTEVNQCPKEPPKKEKTQPDESCPNCREREPEPLSPEPPTPERGKPPTEYSPIPDFLPSGEEKTAEEPPNDESETGPIWVKLPDQKKKKRYYPRGGCSCSSPLDTLFPLWLLLLPIIAWKIRRSKL